MSAPQTTAAADPHEDDAGPRGTLLVTDRVVTLGHGRYHARAVLVRGKRVVWVGDDPQSSPPHAHRLDLDGCVLTPSFVDAHVHLTPTGITMRGLDLSGVTSGAELLRALRTYADQHTGRVIWGHGYDPHAFPDDLPGPRALSEAALGRAVYLSRVDGHSALVDRSTLAAAPLARANGVERDQEGRPTGVVKRDANHIVRRWSVGAMDDHDLAAARQTVVQQAARLGITSVHEMGGSDIMGAEDFDTWRTGRWPVEVVPYWGDLELGFVVERDLRQIGGDLFLDGTLGSHTAALSSPYTDKPKESGHLEYDDATVTDLFREATHAGIQVGVHAVGDEAIRQAVRCWHAVRDQLPDYLAGSIRRLRHRLEHAEVLPPDLLGEVADLGLVVSAQPSFEAAWGGEAGMYGARLGASRTAWTNAYRALADRGVALAFGSDSSVSPLDPWHTVYAAEQHPDPERAITRLEAVSASTLGGRNAARQERSVGVVRAGMLADLAVWEGDPFEVEDPRGTRCVLTVHHGRVTHGHAPLPTWQS